tara:strand:+ start:39008 stop:39556 length:549 start_codon:yes stop_codon:yes gene_type:complete
MAKIGCCSSGSGSGDVEAFPPAETGQNVSQTQVATLQDNTVDSVASDDINAFTEVKQSGLSFASAIYNTGNLVLDATRMRLNNNSGKPFSFKVTIGGIIISDTSINSALFRIRLNSTSNVGTGTTRRYPSGLTVGGTSVELGVSTSGAFTLADGESMWLECSKSVLGTLIMQSCLILVEPIW